MAEKSPAPATVLTLVASEYVALQRIDNYLFVQLKGVPKTRIYRALRSGEVRVNKKRVVASYRLQPGDVIRIPPLRMAAEPKTPLRPALKVNQLLSSAIIYEDSDVIVLNKPSGIASHGGSGISFGAIEWLRHVRPQFGYLELAHRLDRDTTGCLLVAKKPSVLKELHRQLAEGMVEKTYLAIVAGRWQGGVRRIEAPLLKNICKSGERIVTVSASGKLAVTVFRPLHIFATTSLMEVKPLTGRTHQIRVHAALAGHAILGDKKYAPHDIYQAFPVPHLLLHAAALRCTLPRSGITLALCACLDQDFLSVWSRFASGTNSVDQLPR